MQELAHIITNSDVISRLEESLSIDPDKALQLKLGRNLYGFSPIDKMVPLASRTRLTQIPIDLFTEKMKAEGIDGVSIEIFSQYYRQITSGADGLLREKDLETVDEKQVPAHEELGSYEAFGRSNMHRTARIVLNGGLGTCMGLTTAKSLVAAKDGQTFLDIILSGLRGEKVPLCLMNSTNTHEETCRYLARHAPDIVPLTFFQHRFPKIFRETLMPAQFPENPSLEWNPAGHGDVYNSLYISGMLQELLDQGICYAFISNSDNLGATLDPSLLGYFAKNKLPFMMEVAKRTKSDAKGGHLAGHRDGSLVLRERAQCPPEEMSAFQDIRRYPLFNTNNIWINLGFLKNLIRREGFISLPLILNPKSLDPRNDKSPAVYQAESAMGAGISLFPGAKAVCVPRSRFFPIKTTNDLLLLRSDRFMFSRKKGLIPVRGTDDIKISLDPQYYSLLDRFEKRFSRGVPSLKKCDSLTINGDVYFEKDVTIRGRVTISALGANRHVIPEGTVIDGDLSL